MVPGGFTIGGCCMAGGACMEGGRCMVGGCCIAGGPPGLGACIGLNIGGCIFVNKLQRFFFVF